jgi:hypothetical protein
MPIPTVYRASAAIPCDDLAFSACDKCTMPSARLCPPGPCPYFVLRRMSVPLVQGIVCAERVPSWLCAESASLSLRVPVSGYALSGHATATGARAGDESRMGGPDGRANGDPPGDPPKRRSPPICASHLTRFSGLLSDPLPSPGRPGGGRPVRRWPCRACRSGPQCCMGASALSPGTVRGEAAGHFAPRELNALGPCPAAGAKPQGPSRMAASDARPPWGQPRHVRHVTQISACAISAACAEPYTVLLIL